MGDDFNRDDEHHSRWFNMNPNQKQQTEPKQYEGFPAQQMIQAQKVDNRNAINSATAQQHQQDEGGYMRHQIFYPPPQYQDQNQSQATSTEVYQQVFQQRGGFHHQTSALQYRQHRERQEYSNYQQQQYSGAMMSQAQQHISTSTGNRNDKAKLRSERKRIREKQRRDSINQQLGALTKVLKRLELEERGEPDRKARMVADRDSLSKTSPRSLRLPFIAPNNSVDLIAYAISHLEHLHSLSKRQQDDINRLEDELETANKSMEDTSSKLKKVLLDFHIPQPYVGLTTQTLNRGNIDNTNNNGNNNTNTMVTGAKRSSGNPASIARASNATPNLESKTASGHDDGSSSDEHGRNSCNNGEK